MTEKIAQKMLLGAMLVLSAQYTQANVAPIKEQSAPLSQPTSTAKILQKSIAPSDIFWHQALKFGQYLEDMIRDSEACADELSELHNSSVRAVKSLGPLDYVRWLSTKGKWQAVQAQLVARDDFRNAFTTLMQSDALGGDDLTQEELCQAYRNFQALVIDVLETANILQNGTCSAVGQSAEVHVRDTQRYIDLLAHSKNPAKSGVWYDKLKRLVWGSSWSYDVAPVAVRFLPFLHAWYKIRQGQLDVGGAAADLNDMISEVKQMGFFARLRNVPGILPQANGLFSSFINQMQEVAGQLGGQGNMLFMLKKEEIFSGVLGAGGEIYKALQQSEYDRRKKDDEKHVDRAKRKVKRAHDTSTTFRNIVGYTEAKSDLSIIISALANPVKFMRWGAEIPKGILLEGPPGTGKTLFARALAGEANCPFYRIDASELVDQSSDFSINYENDTVEETNKLKDLFAEAQENAPSIIFIDELDFIGRRRDNVDSKQSKVLAQLLTQLSGFEKQNPYRPVLVIAATNCADDLDFALTRSERFDLKIHVDLPSAETRRDLFVQQLPAARAMIGAVDYDKLAAVTKGFNCADIVGVVKKHATMHATSKGRAKITMDDLLAGVEKVRSGLSNQL